jgi:hypothetical protein
MAQFDRKSAERIGRVVGYVEGMLRSEPAGRRATPIFPPMDFLGKITDSDHEGKYSWTMQAVQSDGTLADDDGGRSGDYEDETGFARESLWQSKDVPIGSIVRLRPALGQDFLIFDYNGAAIYVLLSEDLLEGGSVDATVSVGGNGTVKVHSTFTDQIDSGTFTWCVYGGGKWWANAEDCNA